MIISFIGGGARVEKCAQLFMNRSNFKIGGFYCNPINDCADIAISTNTCLFSCIDDLCKASDAVFIATEDEILPAVVHTLTRLHIHGKIIISCAADTYGGHLDNGYDNTNIIMESFIPFELMNDNEINEAFVTLNGVGSRLDEFADALKASGIRFNLLSNSELDLFRAACHIMQYGIRSCIDAGRRLSKIATSSGSFTAMPLIKNAVKDAFGSCPTPYTEGNIAQVSAVCDTLEELGIESITGLFKAIAAYSTESSEFERDVADDMMNALNSR